MKSCLDCKYHIAGDCLRIENKENRPIGACKYFEKRNLNLKTEDERKDDNK